MQTTFFRYRWIELLMFLEKEKIYESLMRFAHVLIILLYIGLRRLV